MIRSTLKMCSFSGRVKTQDESHRILSFSSNVKNRLKVIDPDRNQSRVSVRPFIADLKAGRVKVVGVSVNVM